MTKPKIALLVTDLDDTLWDWFGAWSLSFGALLDALVSETDLPREQLILEIRDVHRRRGTSEYSLLLDELPSLQTRYKHPREDLDGVMHAFYSARLHNTHLYPKVTETLSAVRELGVPIVGYTESLYYATVWRMRHTRLDGLLDVLYSSGDHDFPTGVDKRALRTKSDEEYELSATEHRVVPDGVTKPNIVVLSSIVDDYGVKPKHVAYVGDNLMKDVSMAQALGVRDVHAKYGQAFSKEGYELLQAVSHWSDEQIAVERVLASEAGDVHPRYVLDSGYQQLLDEFDFDPRRG